MSPRCASRFIDRTPLDGRSFVRIRLVKSKTIARVRLTITSAMRRSLHESAAFAGFLRRYFATAVFVGGQECTIDYLHQRVHLRMSAIRTDDAGDTADSMKSLDLNNNDQFYRLADECEFVIETGKEDELYHSVVDGARMAGAELIVKQMEMYFLTVSDTSDLYKFSSPPSNPRVIPFRIAFARSSSTARRARASRCCSTHSAPRCRRCGRRSARSTRSRHSCTCRS